MDLKHFFLINYDLEEVVECFGYDSYEVSYETMMGFVQDVPGWMDSDEIGVLDRSPSHY